MRTKLIASALTALLALGAVACEQPAEVEGGGENGNGTQEESLEGNGMEGEGESGGTEGESLENGGDGGGEEESDF